MLRMKWDRGRGIRVECSLDIRLAKVVGILKAASESRIKGVYARAAAAFIYSRDLRKHIYIPQNGAVNEERARTASGLV